MTGEKLFVREKLKFLLKEFQFTVIENLVKHGRQSAMLHQIFNDFILSAMLLHQ